MLNSKELKLNRTEFDNTIQKLTEYKEQLTDKRNSLISEDNNLKKDWIGKGGTYYIVTSRIEEEKLTETINKLDVEIKDISNTADSLFGLDSYLGKAIDSAINAASDVIDSVK